MAGITYKFKRPAGMSRQGWIRLSSMALRAMKDATPVRTGRLQAGWKPVAVTQRQLVLRNDVPYAEYVNDGNTRGMAPRDMTGRTTMTLNELAGR